MKGAAIMLVGVAMLGACASSSNDYATGADLAKAAGCTGYAKGEAQMFTQETGQCQINGTDIYVATFKDGDARDNWMKTAKAAGASGYFGEGATWVLQGDDKAAVEKGTKQAGGQMS